MVGDTGIIGAHHRRPIAGGIFHGDRAKNAVAPKHADDGSEICRDKSGGTKPKNAGLLSVINDRERRHGNSQRATQRNVLTAEIKLVGATGIGQLELRSEIS